MQVTPLPHPAAITTPRFRHQLGHFDISSTVHLRSTPRISPDAVIAAPFPSTLTTRTLYPSSSWRFEACSCKPAPGGPPPSSTKHPTLLYSPFSSNVSSGHTVSSPGELPPQALSEPYVRLSPHTAPSVQPLRHPSDLAFRPRLLLRRVGPVRAQAEPPAPLRSSPITGPSALLRTLLPLCPASVLRHLWCPPLAPLPSHRDDRFSCSSSKPDSCSRRLYAGHQ